MTQKNGQRCSAAKSFLTLNVNRSNLTIITNAHVQNIIFDSQSNAKMGNDDLALVDNELKIHGIKSLRVIDASIMPTLISGNTNAPTIMIAAKIADVILASWEQI